MEIEEVFIGGWFQRTTLHLTEVYDFLSRAESELELDAVRLQEMRRALELHKVERKNWLLEYVEAIVGKGLKFRMYEDGLIVLQKEVTGDLRQNLEGAGKYYNEKLAPALSFLFSKGAPVPKELVKVSSLLPFILTARNASKEEVAVFFKERGLQTYATIEAPQATVYKSSKIILIVSRNTPEKIRQIVEGQIFFREFKAQLHSYLRIHRRVWDEIAAIKERGKIKGSEIKDLRGKLDAYQKTIKLIESRINQMGSYLRTRGKIYSSQKVDEVLDQVFSYKYETLEDTLVYVKEL